MLSKGILVLLALGVALNVNAGAIPASSCTFTIPGDHSRGFNCNLYPSDGAGNFKGNAVVNFPVGYNFVQDPITPGFLVLVNNPSAIDPITGADPNVNDWTQVLEFTDPTGNGQAAQFMTLFTVGCANDGNLTDRSCFPTYSTIANSGYFFDAAQGSVYVYDPCPDCNARHVYTINFVAETAGVPEPATFFVAGGGVALLALRRRRQKRS